VSALWPLKYAGLRYQCPICGWRLRRLRTSGGPFPAPDSVCPACGSLERHRVLWLYLHDRGDLFVEQLRVLHVAPEPCLEERLRPRANLDYVSTDLEPGTAMTAADLERLPFDDASFHRVLCVHVLEHVTDDGAALRELRRVLAPGGEAIVMVPLLGATTQEDPGATPEERVRRFGQADHVRLYGTDLKERIAAAGLEPRIDHFSQRLTERQLERHRLIPAGGSPSDPSFTDVYVGIRPPAGDPPRPTPPPSRASARAAPGPPRAKPRASRSSPG
jgi:SAM-dependent methyltransferase